MKAKCLLIPFALGLGLALIWVLGNRGGAAVAAPRAEPPSSAPRDRISASNAPTADLTVCTTGPPTCDYSTVQDAVDAANDGDVIKVATGVYTGVQGRPAPDGYEGPDLIDQVVYVSKTVTIQGGYTTAFTDPPDPETNPTTLDAQKQGRVLFVTGDISPTIKGLRITGGDATGLGGWWPSWWTSDAGGGVYVITATATISGSQVLSSTAEYGGGLYIQCSDATLSGNIISSNSNSGLYLYESGATLISNIVSANSAGQGGGLYLWDSGVTLIDNTVFANAAEDTGGGLHLQGGGGATLSGNTITSNTTSSDNYGSMGGGLYLEGSDNATLVNNTVSANVANLGGGLYGGGDDIAFSGNNVISNTAHRAGGGLYVGGSDMTFSGNTIIFNIANEDGGGLLLGEGDIAFSGNTVTFNSAYRGGGLYLNNSDATLINNVVANNQANTVGSGLYIQSSSPRLLHTTIARNRALGGGGDGSGIHITDNGWNYSAVMLANTILVSHTVGITVTAGNTATLEGTLWGDGSWANNEDRGGDGAVLTGTVNLWGDPSFVDPDAGDYHIGGTSAARDAGVDAGVSRDIDGQIRPMGWGYDIGADEYPGAGLVVVKQPSAISVNRGVLTYTIAITSAGTVDATDVVLTDTMDGWQRPITATSSAGDCSVADEGWGGAVVCTPGTLVTGATARVTFTAQVSTTTPLRQVIANAVVVTANETTNSAQATNTVHDCHVRINDDPAEYTTVQAAVDAVNPDDLVKVAGICLGATERNGLRQQIYLDESITIQGGYTTANWTVSDPEANPTTLDALGQGRVLYITGDVSPTVEGLRITGGDAGQGGNDSCGGGVFVHDASVTIRDNYVFSNTADSGGGLCLSESGATLINNIVSANTAGSGGGLYLGESDATLINNAVSANTADQGGGLCLGESDATFINNTVFSNTAPDRGGGLYLDYGSDATLSGNAVFANIAGSGGGLYLYANATTLSGNTISDNVADWGGGVYLGWSDATLSGNTISTNTAHYDGGGVYGNGTLIRNIISGNTAQGNGGGVYGGGTLSGNIISANTADSGGGLSLQMSDAVLTNNIIADNQVNASGSGLYIKGSSLRLLHTTLARNRGGDGSGIHAAFDGPSTVSLTNTILVSHTVGIYIDWDTTARLEGTLWGSGAWANGTDWGGVGTVTTGTVNVWGDPAFVDPGAGDYHIGPGSAAIDAGVHAGVTDDIDGDPRTDGYPDIGADELWITALTVTKQASPDPVQAGGQLTYTIRVTNTGTTELRATITDTLPAEITGGKTSAGTLLLPGGVVTWTPTIIAPDGVWVETVVVTVEAGYAGLLTNVVEVVTEEGATGVYTETALSLAPYLEVTKQAVPDVVQMGEQLTYTIRVTNTGTMDLHAAITDTLPQHVTTTQPLVWTSQLIPAPDGIWTETVVVTVEMGYVGPLTNVVRVATVEGATGIYTETSTVEAGFEYVYLPIVLRNSP